MPKKLKAFDPMSVPVGEHADRSPWAKPDWVLCKGIETNIEQARRGFAWLGS